MNILKLVIFLHPLHTKQNSRIQIQHILPYHFTKHSSFILIIEDEIEGN